MRAVAIGLALLSCACQPSRSSVATATGDGPTGAARGFLRFEPNRGQAAAPVDFLARGAGYTVFLADADAVLALPARPDPAIRAREASYLTMTFVGGMASPRVVAEDSLSGVSNYLIGGDPRQWHVGIPQFGRVRYGDVYAGVDVVYHGGDRLEFDVVVKPGADPGQVRVRLSGATSVTVEPDGSVVAALDGGRVALQPPSVFQDIEGERRTVPGRLVAVGVSDFRFEVGAYDPTRILTIDPLVIVYSTYVGGSGSETATDIAVDNSGNAYVTGQTFSADFPVKGAVQSTQASSEDAYVLKVNPSQSGSASLVYATYLGSTARDGAEAIAVDGLGRAYVTGWTHAGDFPVTPSGLKPTWTPNPNPGDDESDAFVVVLNAAGDQLEYGTFFGGNRDEEGMGIHPSSNDTFVLAGGTDFGSNFPTTTSAFDETGQVRSAFVTVLRWSDNTLLYSTVYHANANVQMQLRGLAVDAAGRAHITGLIGGAGLPVQNAFMPTRSPDATGSFGGFGSFLAVFDPSLSGNASLVYATHLGPGDAEDVAVDTKGMSVVVGSTNVRTFPTTQGAFDRICEDTNPADGLENGPCFKDAFVMKFDPNASGTASLLAATRLGGPRGEDGFGATVGPDDNVYVTGQSSSAAFPPVQGIPGPTAHGDGEPDAFITRFTPDLAALVYSTKFGGVATTSAATGASDRGKSVALAPDGGACIAGETSATDFPITRGFDTSLGGFTDAFVAKIAIPRAPCRELVITTVPGLPFIWEPPRELCVVWDNPRGPFPQPCPPPECPRCGPGLTPTSGPTTMPLALSRFYEEARGVLQGGGVRTARAPRSPHEALLRVVKAVPNGTFFTPAAKTRLERSLERPDRTPAGQQALRRLVTEALNSAELDARSRGVDARQVAEAPKSPSIGGLGRVSRLGSDGSASLELRPGLPAVPRGLDTSWPLASYRMKNAGKVVADARAEVEIYVGWMGFGGDGDMRMLAWNGRSFRDATLTFDATNGVLRGRVGFLEDIVVVRVQPCKQPLVLP